MGLLLVMPAWWQRRERGGFPKIQAPFHRTGLPLIETAVLCPRPPHTTHNPPQRTASAGPPVQYVTSVPKSCRSWCFSILPHLPRGLWRPPEDDRMEVEGPWVPVSLPGRPPAKQAHCTAEEAKNKRLVGEAAEIWGFLSYCWDGSLHLQRNSIF